jgi:hypothetical protein
VSYSYVRTLTSSVMEPSGWYETGPMKQSRIPLLFSRNVRQLVTTYRDDRIVA